MASLPGRRPMVLDLVVLLGLLLRALDLYVACHRRRRHTMSPRVLTMPLRRSSHHSLFKPRHLQCITSSNHHSLTASQTPTTVLLRTLVAYPHLPRRHPQA